MSSKIEVSREHLESVMTYGCITPESNEAWESLRASLDAPVVERQPVAYAVFAENGNIRCWSRTNTATGLLVAAEDGTVITPLYTSQPAVVSVVLERLTPAELEELEVIEVLLHGQGLSNLAGTMAAARQFIDEVACLDNLKELNR